jgi:hypothetical protein
MDYLKRWVLNMFMDYGDLSLLCALSSATVIYLFALAGSGRDNAPPDFEDFRVPPPQKKPAPRRVQRN